MINQHQDVWLTTNGNLATSVKYIPDGHTSEEKAMYGKLREVLRRIAGFTPMQLATMKDDYDRLEFVYHEPAVIMSDDTRKAIKQALVEGKVVPPPLMPPTD